MKIAPAAADRFVTAPDANLVAVLVYGPDSGLVRERSAALMRAVVEDPADPFRVAELAGAVVRDDPARLADEAAALSLIGGRRAVRVRDAGDPLAAAFAALLEQPAGDSLVIAESGELGPRSSLRTLFEGAANAAALACYADDARALPALIRGALAAHEIRIERDALAYLVANLGADRLATRSELDKLALYVGRGNTATLDDAAACVGDGAAFVVEEVGLALGDGDARAVAAALRRAFLEGVSPVQVLRRVAQHVQRLQLAAAQCAGGKSPDEALQTLRPPVFFRHRDRMAAQLRRWPVDRLGRALARLTAAEIGCKTTGMPDHAICRQTLLELAADRP